MLVLLRFYGVRDGMLCSYYACISDDCSTNVHNKLDLRTNGQNQNMVSDRFLLEREID